MDFILRLKFNETFENICEKYNWIEKRKWT